MPYDQEHRRRSYHDAMQAGASEYADVLAGLNRLLGIHTSFTQTGGMNAALHATLDGGGTLLITDANETLSWRREDQIGWGVGLYLDEVSDVPIAYETTPDGSLDSLVRLIRRVLGSVSIPSRS